MLLALTSCKSQERIEAERIDKIRPLVVDSSATKETLILFQNLLDLTTSDSALIGQHEGLWPAPLGEPSSHFENIFGRNPAVLGKDYMDIIDNGYDSKHLRLIELVRQAMQMSYRRGNLNVMCWHYREPEERRTFYVKEMQGNKKDSLFRSILPGGKNHEAYKGDLKQIADFSKSLVGDNGELIPYIFRPFHEFDGDWFWWGANYCTPQEFIDVWRFTVHYLRDTLQVHNILYGFSPDIRFDSREKFLERYPGDEYVDLIGFDDYYDFRSNIPGQTGPEYARKRITIVNELAKERKKIAALTETGYFIKKNTGTLDDEINTNALLKVLTEITPQVSFIMFWSNGGTYDYCVPLPGEIASDSFVEFGNKDNTLLEEDYKYLYKLKAK